MLAEDYLHPVATAESVGGRHTLRPAMERQTRGDMQSEPSHEAVDKEIAYRWSQEVSAMGKLTNDELKMVYKTGMNPSEYVASRDG